MIEESYTTRFLVDRDPQQVFHAVNQVAGWWSGEVEGRAAKAGDSFTYNVPGVHFSRQKVTEFVPVKKVVWHVTEARLSFLKDPAEWVGTDIVFEISPQGAQTELRFTHRGLVPEFECHEACSNAWGMLVGANLRRWILTGETQPSPW